MYNVVSSYLFHRLFVSHFCAISYVQDTETTLYYLQSRYYDPELGRFINADALVSTGQGILGNNMFAYCGNKPATTVDPSGNAWCKISFDAFSPFDSWYIPLGGGGMAAGNSFAASRAYQRENEEEPNAIFDTGDIDYGSFSYRQKALIWGASGIEPDSGGINIVNAEAALMSATISKNGDSLSFGDIGVLRANASFGILSFEVEALAAYWAPSAKIDLGLVVINLEAYLGGVGLTAEATSEELRFGIAAGIGFSAGIEWK